MSSSEHETARSEVSIVSIAGCSFVPPEGWVMMQAPGDQYAACRGPLEDGFQPTIGITDTADFRAEPFEGSLEEYVDWLRQKLARFSEGPVSELVRCTTEVGKELVKLTYEWMRAGRKTRTWEYIFEGPDGEEIRLCGHALAERATEYERMFDGVAKTLKVHR